MQWCLRACDSVGVEWQGKIERARRNWETAVGECSRTYGAPRCFSAEGAPGRLRKLQGINGPPEKNHIKDMQLSRPPWAQHGATASCAARAPA